MQVQRTPSVYFHLEDGPTPTPFTQREGLFSLSKTQPPAPFLTSPSHQLIPQPVFNSISSDVKREAEKRLTTQQFYKEFDSNFVVTFENPSPLKTIHPKIVPSEPSHYSSGDSWPHQASREGSILNAESSEKSSPFPAFAVKRRTVFKSKACIAQANPAKTTRQQIINHHNLKEFTDRPRSLQPRRSKFPSSSEQVLTSKQPRPTPLQPLKAHNTESIFVDAKAVRKDVRQSLRAITWDCWRNKLRVGRQKKRPHQSIFAVRH